MAADSSLRLITSLLLIILSIILPNTLNASNSLPTVSPPPAGGVVYGYYTSKSSQIKNYPPTHIPATELTHLVYAYFTALPNGTVVPGDPYVDLQLPYPEDDPSQPGHHIFGNLKQIGILKHQNRGLKVLLGIGGAAGSQHFSTIAASETLRHAFAISAVSWMLDLGLDGLQIDWQFPTSSANGNNLSYLLYSIQQVLTASHEYMMHVDPYSAPFILSASFSGVPASLVHLPLGTLSLFLNYMIFQCFNYAGKWSRTIANQAQFFGIGDNCQNVLQHAVSQNVPRNKIVAGIPAFGRAFDGVQYPYPGAPFNGVGQGEYEDGVWDYKSLPLYGTTVAENSTTLSASTFDAALHEWISFDTDKTVGWKTYWLRTNGFAGVSIWELSGDKPTGEGSLAQAAKSIIAMLPNGLDTSQNRLDYSIASRFDNIKNGLLTNMADPAAPLRRRSLVDLPPLRNPFLPH